MTDLPENNLEKMIEVAVSKAIKQVITRAIPAQEYFNTQQTAAYLGFSRQRLEIWRCYGGGPKYVKLAQAVRYKRTDLDAFMAEHTQTASVSVGV